MQGNYPRPQMKRVSWQSLDECEWLINGLPGKVPSCRTEEELHYETHFSYVKENARCILNFGAVDQLCKVFINKKPVGSNQGGYLPFSFDITNFLLEGDNLLEVDVTDKLDHFYPYGKQKKDRGGMWYTPVSGVWQSVWLEQLPEKYIKSVKITPDLSGANLRISLSNGEKLSERVEVENPELWTPDTPKLYTHTVSVGEDSVEIYFALRIVDIRNIGGANRVCLNGEPIFIHGVLDQGYFNPGLFIPKDKNEYENDVRRMKELGFNTLRKHIKIEPEEFYYACDRLGMLVIQDMVNSGSYSFMRDTALGTLGVGLKDNKPVKDKGEEGRREFWKKHTVHTVQHLHNHPCIIAYTLFNEGWGQFCADYAYDAVKNLDPTRLIDSASGWFAQSKSDFDSEHIYFRLKKLKPKTRPLLISECGGYTLNLDGRKSSYGYGRCKDSAELTRRICEMYEKMIISGIKQGVCGCIYTQLSDIEDEINGLYSYNRKVCKVEKEPLRIISKRLEEEMKKIQI